MVELGPAQPQLVFRILVSVYYVLIEHMHHKLVVFAHVSKLNLKLEKGVPRKMDLNCIHVGVFLSVCLSLNFF